MSWTWTESFFCDIYLSVYQKVLPNLPEEGGIQPHYPAMIVMNHNKQHRPIASKGTAVTHRSLIAFKTPDNREKSYQVLEA